MNIIFSELSWIEGSVCGKFSFYIPLSWNETKGQKTD